MSVNANTPPAEAAIATMSKGGFVLCLPPGRSGGVTTPPAPGQLGSAHPPVVPSLLEARSLHLQQDDVRLLNGASDFWIRLLSESVAERKELALEGDQGVVRPFPASSLVDVRRRGILPPQAITGVAEAPQETRRRIASIGHQSSGPDRHEPILVRAEPT